MDIDPGRFSTDAGGHPRRHGGELVELGPKRSEERPTVLRINSKDSRMPAAPGDALDAATRIAATATRTRYDGVSIALHWLTALLVFVLFGMALIWPDQPRPVRQQMIGLHLTLGLVLIAALVWRVTWRLTPGHQVQSAVTGLTEKASKAMQGLLYLLLIGQTALGLVARWTAGRAMLFFGLEIPSILPKVNHDITEQLEKLHGKIGWSIVILALGHAAAALFHHYVLRDQVLARMLPAGRKRTAG